MVMWRDPETRVQPGSDPALRVRSEERRVSGNQEWRKNIYSIPTKGEHFIHNHIYSDTYPKGATGVVGIDNDSIIYINLYHFALLSHSPTMAYRHGH